MTPHERCAECQSTIGCAHTELAADLHRVAPHHPGPPEAPHPTPVGTPKAAKLVYERPRERRPHRGKR